MGLLGKAVKGAPGNDRLTEHPGSLHLQSFTRRKLGLIVTREKWDFPFPHGIRKALQQTPTFAKLGYSGLQQSFRLQAQSSLLPHTLS